MLPSVSLRLICRNQNGQTIPRQLSCSQTLVGFNRQRDETAHFVWFVVKKTAICLPTSAA
jgi:hypothetical protein